MLEKGAKAYPIAFREDTGYWYVRHFKTYPRTIMCVGRSRFGSQVVFFEEDRPHIVPTLVEDVFDTFRDASLECERRNDVIRNAGHKENLLFS